MGTALIVIIVSLILLLSALAMSAAVVVSEFERGVVLTLGRFSGVREPGLRFIIPALQQLQRVDIREETVDVPRQEVITKDNIKVKVNAIINFRVIAPAAAILHVTDFRKSTRENGQAVLRSCVGGNELDHIADPTQLALEIGQVLARKTEHWGIEVCSVEIKEIEVDPAMVRALSRQAEAERERRALVIDAAGQRESAEGFLEAAEILSRNPDAMRLRYLATLGDISANKGTVIVFPFPTDFREMLGAGAQPALDKIPPEAGRLLQMLTGTTPNHQQETKDDADNQTLPEPDLHPRGNGDLRHVAGDHP